MNYINIRPRDCRYIINKEKRKVVCIIDNTQFKLRNFLFSHLPYGIYPELELSPRYIGIATCAKEDEWNENLGKRIAFHKAKVKFDTSFFKRANSFIQDQDDKLNRMIDSLNAYGAKAAAHADSREKFINSSFKEE